MKVIALKLDHVCSLMKIQKANANQSTRLSGVRRIGDQEKHALQHGTSSIKLHKTQSDWSKSSPQIKSNQIRSHLIASDGIEPKRIEGDRGSKQVGNQVDRLWLWVALISLVAVLHPQFAWCRANCWLLWAYFKANSSSLLVESKARVPWTLSTNLGWVRFNSLSYWLASCDCRVALWCERIDSNGWNWIARLFGPKLGLFCITLNSFRLNWPKHSGPTIWVATNANEKTFPPQQRRAPCSEPVRIWLVLSWRLAKTNNKLPEDRLSCSSRRKANRLQVAPSGQDKWQKLNQEVGDDRTLTTGDLIQLATEPRASSLF